MILKSTGAVLALLWGCSAVSAEPTGTAPMSAPVVIAAATSAEQCLKQAFELSDKIASKELNETDLDRLDDMLAEMETHCETNRFADAAAVANTISVELSQQE